MRSRFLAVTLALVALAIGASAQTPTPDQLNMLKNLPQDQQDALLQQMGGKTDSSGKRTDPKLSTPQTVQPKGGVYDQYVSKEDRGKTRDGRVLRVTDEDPELRPDD
ncbi:MAG: hypothetical protein QOD56_52, partial [Gammaproteobacteria bacterium]|nr:hypothetical protein [Gammaproteobacteria bacterium]